MIHFATVKERTEEIIMAEKDAYFLYGIFFQPRVESDELKKKGIKVTLKKLCRLLECTPNDIVKFTDE